MEQDEIDVKLANFLVKISNWMNLNDITYPSDNFQDINKIECILDGNPVDFRDSTAQQCQENLFVLNQYLYRLNVSLSKEKSVKAWAEQGINFLIASKEFSPYIKWEEKKFIIVKESKIAAKLQELKTVSDARIIMAEAMIKKVENAMRIIENIGRTKIYERT